MSAIPPSAPPPSYSEATNYGYNDTNQAGVGFQPTYNPPPPAFHADTTHAAVSNSDDYEGYGNYGASFGHKAVRHAFIRKVYLILMAQLLVTIAFICIFLFVDDVHYWVRANSWFYWISYGVFFTTMIILVCCPGFRRNYPWNFICLLIFTLAFSYMVGTICTFYNAEAVLYAGCITAALCLAITLFAVQTKFQARILQIVYGGIGALVFSLFLVYDTQQIVGGRKHNMSPEEYIYGALQLYLDVVYIFLMILSLFGGKD